MDQRRWGLWSFYAQEWETKPRLASIHAARSQRRALQRMGVNVTHMIPCSTDCGLEDINLRFTHYRDYDEDRARRKRIAYAKNL